MEELKKISHLAIEWDICPEDAVTLYLEWGNNNWHAPFPPVRSKDDYIVYFVVDTWHEPPLLRLLRRNSEQLEELLEFELPAMLLDAFKAEYGELRGVFEPTPAIKDWLKAAIA